MEKNAKKLDMASVEWLATHHFSKSPHRFSQMLQLDIRPGDKILEFGCGPGFYTKYFCDLVGPEGHVTGIDHDPISLDYANNYLSGFPYKNWELISSEITSYVKNAKNHNVAIFFNCIGYIPNAIEVIGIIRENLEEPKRIIVKDFDLSSVFISPLKNGAYERLTYYAKMGNYECNPLKFDNFFGKKVPFLHIHGQYYQYKNDIWSQIMSYPFNPYEKKYISKNIESLILQAEANCDPNLIKYFRKEFIEQDYLFFQKKDGFFIENEYLTTLYG